ncbi:hypothetical protein J2Z21_003031 [Streptomyces griseochromogenes]|uniref:Uncharacterized protein n=1 Tax=Streptomyces griseochromogenes TaxID=68214 RepID=A0A1B1AXB9_9ACTN|nr:hypothetical protein [Streptomyces griseochromogenes]ANP51226.1 hypothetical protein AVL59_17790 [Streptomyces griseochromogenes]MBP2050095.1 hypothetical protein [Streptomyces griseochromogenes]
MISTRRIVATVGLAVGVTGLAAPLANAAGAGTPHTGQINPMAAPDPHAIRDIPAQRKSRSPRVAVQTRALDQLENLDRLNGPNQLTGRAAPVAGLLPAVEA